MPDYFVPIAPLSAVNICQINITRNHDSIETRGTTSCTSIKESMDWFEVNDRASGSDGVGSIKFSEFKGAQVLTASICTAAESYDGSYCNCNDGKICISVEPLTVNNPISGAGERDILCRRE